MANKATGNASPVPVVTDSEDVSHLLSGGGKSIPLFKVHLPESVLQPLNSTLMSGYIGQGPKVDQFEEQLAPWMGGGNVLTTSSGTASLHLAMRLAGVGEGDEVITTAMTCTATNVPILERGARIVWADIDPLTGNIDPQEVEKKISPKTKAIVVVHWGGYPCDLDELNAIAKKHGVKLIEDAAHAFSGSYKGQAVGSHSDFTCFSFQAIKHLTTVDGGALVCRDSEDHKRGKLLRWYGIDREGERSDFRCEADVAEFGYKFHMNDVAATIGMEQLKHVKSVVDRHQANAAYYNDRLGNLKGVKLLNYKADRQSAYWLYTILVDDRLDFMQEMTDAGIVVSQVHSRNDEHTMMKDFRTTLPGVDSFIAKQVSIPVGWWLTEEQREFIADTIIRLRG